MNKPRLSLIVSMLIFGTIGIFVRFAQLPSAVIALGRGLIGSVVILLAGLLFFGGINWTSIRRNLPTLIASGIALGFNWILLFESFRYTTVSIGTICYYVAPVLVTLASPFFFKEKLTGVRLLCVAAALGGLGLVVGSSSGSVNNFVGILFGLGAAVIYAVIVILNKSLRNIGSLERTFTQLGISALSLIPYVLLTGDLQRAAFTPQALWILLLLGMVHTGLAYLLYFSALGVLPGQTVAVFSYIDPVFAILLSALILSEPLTIVQILGGVLVLGAMLVSELYANRQAST